MIIIELILYIALIIIFSGTCALVHGAYLWYDEARDNRREARERA